MNLAVSLLSLLPLASLVACGASVTPELDSSHVAPDASTAERDATPDAAALGEVIDTLVALPTTTYAIDVRGRAFGWGFIHFEGNGEYREPHRIPLLDGARAIRSIESLFTCAIFNNELRCSVLHQPWRRVAWADGLADYAITTSPIQLWVLGRDGQVQFSAGRSLSDLAQLSDSAPEGRIPLRERATSIDCQQRVCCAGGPSALQCWGQHPATFGDPSPRPTAISLGDAERVFFSRSSETLCRLGVDHAPSCWGSGVYEAFGLRRSAPQLQAPEVRCASEGSTTDVCVGPPGLALAQLHYVHSVTNNSTQLVLGYGDHWAVERAPAPWATSLAPATIAVHPRTTSTMTVLQGLSVGSRLSVGGSHACWTRDENRRVLCAGSNFAGQIGIDRRTQHDDRTPVEVRLPR